MTAKTSTRHVDEFGLIDRIERILSSRSTDKQLVLGMGDDAAVFKTSKNTWNVATVDALAEGVHFDMRFTDFKQLGRKAMASNLSDIAAMGAVPQWALIHLSIPAGVTVKNITDLYRGISAYAKKFGTQVIGGNIARAQSEWIIVVTLLGEVKPANMLKRSGAKPGDIVAVTGDLGGSHAGLKILRHAMERGKFPYVIRKHLTPAPRNEWIQKLLQKGIKINACIDISDGLSSDLHHVCRSSKVGAELIMEQIPYHPETQKVAAFLNEKLEDYILHGGEEYELLMTFTRSNFEKARIVLGKHITPIGTINTSRTLTALCNGRKIRVQAKGYKHF